MRRGHSIPDVPQARPFEGRYTDTTLFAALNTATGQIHAGHYQRKRGIEFLDFTDQLLALHPGKQLHVILDNLSSHLLEKGKWVKQHPQALFHYTPTHASWLNQVEVWFSILTEQALRGTNFRSVKELVAAMCYGCFIKAYNQNATPFQWTKIRVSQKSR